MKLVSATNSFALDLYQQLGQENVGQNVLFSPASVSLAIAMTYLGARGQTAQQIAQVLKFTDVDSSHLHTSFADLQKILHETGGNYTLHVANRLFGHNKFTFLQVC